MNTTLNRKKLKSTLSFDYCTEDLIKLLLDYYEECISMKIQFRTIQLYNRDWIRFVQFYSKTKGKKIISLDDIKEVKRYLAQAYVMYLSEIGMKNSSIKTYRTQANVFFEYLTLNGHIDTNEFGKPVKFPYEEKKIPKYYNPSDGDKLVQVAKSIKMNKWNNRPFMYQAILAMIIYLGLRKEEICHFKKEWYFNYKDKGEIKVEGKGKGGKKERNIILFKEAIPYIENYINSEEYSETEYMFNTQYGVQKHISPSFVDKLFKMCKVAVGAQHFTPHAGRKVIYEKMKKDGYDNEMIRIQLGHESFNTTMNFYRQLQDIDVINSAKVLNQ